MGVGVVTGLGVDVGFKVGVCVGIGLGVVTGFKEVVEVGCKVESLVFSKVGTGVIIGVENGEVEVKTAFVDFEGVEVTSGLKVDSTFGVLMKFFKNGMLNPGRLKNHIMP